MSNRIIELEATLRLALEALETGKPMFDAYWGSDHFGNAITAIKEALARPEQEPQPPYKFERYVSGSLRAQGVMVERATKLADAMRIAAKICPPANPPSAPTVLVYTTPPQRTWVGLTDEERWDCLEASRRNADCRDALVKAVEAKLKEKNT